MLTWLHLSRRDKLQIHPGGDVSRPLTGVFAPRSPLRFNPIGLHRVTGLEIAGPRLHVAALDAIDGMARRERAFAQRKMSGLANPAGFDPTEKQRRRRRLVQFLEAADAFEHFENALRLFFIDARQSKANVNQNVIADLRFGYVFKADPFADAAELHLRHAHLVFEMCLEDFSRNRETHKAGAGALECAAGEGWSSRSGYFARAREDGPEQGGQRDPGEEAGVI